MEQYNLLHRLVRCFESLDIPYIVTGSMASMAYGEPRFTNDIDVVADMRDEHIKGLRECFPADEFYVSEDAVKMAIQRRQQFNIIHPSSGLKIDVMIRKKNAFDDSRFQRYRKLNFTADASANFSAPEDVIIKKMEYYKEGGSEKHLRDITGILKVSGEIIDFAYIKKWAEKLNIAEIWEALLKRIGG